jgi:hypothetical protein
VTDQQLAQAQADIEIFTNRIYADTARIRTRDLHWLGQAVARQAAWLAGQFGLETRLDATQIQQDQVSTTLHGRRPGPRTHGRPRAAEGVVDAVPERAHPLRCRGRGPARRQPAVGRLDDSLVWAPYHGGA